MKPKLLDHFYTPSKAGSLSEWAMVCLLFGVIAMVVINILIAIFRSTSGVVILAGLVMMPVVLALGFLVSGLPPLFRMLNRKWGRK